MIYRLVQADEVVARLDNDFNVLYGDSINRIPQWIYQCLSDLNLRTSLVPKAMVVSVDNYTATIPDDLKFLTCIEYKGVRLTRRSASNVKLKDINDPYFAYVRTSIGVTVAGAIKNVTLDDSLSDIKIDVDKIRVYDASSVTSLSTCDSSYYLLPNGTIETSFKSGVVVFHYYAMASSYNERLNSECPLIPDHEAVKDAIAWYIFKNMLQRGHTHPVFRLGHNNPVLDPFSMYRRARLNARNKSSEEDRDQAKIIDDMWNSHLYNVISNYR